MTELKTSEEWKEELYPNIIILDPDGWDRKNFYQSWNEPITKKEFERRLRESTIQEVKMPDNKSRNKEIICLCGSTKFKKEFQKEAVDEALKGNIVLTCEWFSHVDGYLKPTQEEILKENHYEKIRICDKVVVLNINGYIGEGLRDEIEFAEQLDKKIEYRE